MNIGAFEQLSEDEKLKTLLSGGHVISERNEGNYRSFLYYLGTFYAAVQYEANTDEMIKITSFEGIGSKERIEWKVLRMLSDNRYIINKNPEELI